MFHYLLSIVLTWETVADQVEILLHRHQHFVSGAVDAPFGLEMFVMGLVTKRERNIDQSRFT